MNAINLLPLLIYFWINMMIFIIVKCYDEMNGTQPRNIKEAIRRGIPELFFGLPIFLSQWMRNKKDERIQQESTY